MPITSDTMPLPVLDLRQRRDALFEIHSILRSADNLRPEEAFDELVKLYAVWLSAGPVSLSDAQRADPSLTLSESAFQRATEILGPVLLAAQRDAGADIFQELVDVGVRAGLGQYFTPSPIARAIAAYLSPGAGEAWIDPFCGSGLLLGEIASAAQGPLRLVGIDRDPRVLRLATLEAEIHHPGIPLHVHQANALAPLQELTAALGASSEGFDGVVTNPPFGAEIHPQDQATYGDFSLARPKSTPLEILGLERCIQILKPGGRLGIVVPQSILSNRGCRDVREFLLRESAVDAVLSLPTEAFGPFKGVGKAAVIFATRKQQGSRSGTVLAMARSVGWDSTGRANGGEDVTATARLLREPTSSPVGSCVVVSEPRELERNMTPEWHLRPRAEGPLLRELTATIFTGRTPGRSAYQAAEDPEASATYRVLKVGDLTGNGIDWAPGERSFATFSKPVRSKLLALNDVALTAAAHSPRYIGAKVDVVDCLPLGFEDWAFPCAEVMIVRPEPERIDPFLLLLWLRSPEGRSAIQACVTGQTAHLYPDDVADIIVPRTVLDADHEHAIQLLKESLRLRRLAEADAEEARVLFDASLAAPASRRGRSDRHRARG